jgi:hypothetical protein
MTRLVLAIFILTWLALAACVVVLVAANSNPVCAFGREMPEYKAREPAYYDT